MAENWDQHRIPVSHDGAGPIRLNPDFSDNFHMDLRVLVYAQNLVDLLNYAECLDTNKYKVNITSSKEEAINQLCKHRNMFDIALIEVDKPEGYIFQSIAQIGMQSDRPIIIISKDASKESVMKWMSNGAWDCLIEPSNYDLKYTFKHELRRRLLTGEKATGEKSSSLGPNYNGDHSSKASSKKRRCVWDYPLHKKFIDAVNHFGIDKAIPKNILAYIGDPNLTRDNVASHLQKYRQKEKEKEKKKSLNISEDKRQNVGEEATELKTSDHINNIILQQQNIINPNNILMPHPNLISSSFRPHHDEVSVARLMTHQPISEQQNIINPNNILMPHPNSISSSFRPHHGEVSVAPLITHPPISEQQNIINLNNILVPHPNPISSSFRLHHGEVFVALLMTHQPISEQQNTINSTNLMPHPIPSSFSSHHGEISVARMMMTLQQYQTTNFMPQPNSNNYLGHTNFWLTNMDDAEMDFANLETDSEFTNNSSYPDQNNN